LAKGSPDFISGRRGLGWPWSGSASTLSCFWSWLYELTWRKTCIKFEIVECWAHCCGDWLPNSLYASTLYGINMTDRWWENIGLKKSKKNSSVRTGGNTGKRSNFIIIKYETSLNTPLKRSRKFEGFFVHPVYVDFCRKQP